MDKPISVAQLAQPIHNRFTVCPMSRRDSFPERSRLEAGVPVDETHPTTEFNMKLAQPLS
jgi:hypothetical protein